MGFFGLLSNDLAIDLGTANTLIWVRAKGVVLREPSIVAFDKNSKRIVAIGHEARENARVHSQGYPGHPADARRRHR